MGIATQAVVAMDAACNLTCCIQTSNGLALLIQNKGIHVNLKTSHAVMNHWGDDGHVELLGLDSGARDDVVEELLSRTCLAAGLIPCLAAWKCCSCVASSTETSIPISFANCSPDSKYFM